MPGRYAQPLQHWLTTQRQSAGVRPSGLRSTSEIARASGIQEHRECAIMHFLSRIVTSGVVRKNDYAAHGVHTSPAGTASPLL